MTRIARTNGKITICLLIALCAVALVISINSSAQVGPVDQRPTITPPKVIAPGPPSFQIGPTSAMLS